MTLKHDITKALHRKATSVYICIGCHEFGLNGLDETTPYKVPDWVLNNPYRNRIRSGVCPSCFENYKSRKLENLKKRKVIKR